MKPGARAVRIVGALAVAAAATTALLGHAARGGASSSPAQASAQVAVIPGFVAPRYPGYWGIPTFPLGAKELAGYHFGQVSADAITSAALQPYDTIVLYGLRWNTLSAAAQAAINTFARTGKVLISDSDATGPQDYASFVHPFATDASGENGHTNGSVVSFPSGADMFASPDSSSPYYIDPSQLVADKNLINDMSAMKTGTPQWAPALIAANKSIPAGGWVVAWGYGATGDHSGMVIYSGIDADAFNSTSSPNYALKELALQLSAPFRRSADTSCAPNCGAPTLSGGGTTGTTGRHRTYAQCSFARPVPSAWVRGRISLMLRTSIASGITAKTLTAKGKVVASSTTAKPGRLVLVVNTRLLPSNQTSRLVAVVFVKSVRACKIPLSLKVDNVAPAVQVARTSRDGRGAVLELRVNETARVSISAPGLARRHLSVVANKAVEIVLPPTTATANLMISDRAGNQATRKVVWH